MPRSEAAARGDRDLGVLPSHRLFTAAALELLALVREEHVEAGQRAVTAADVTLELHLLSLWKIRGVDVLLERAEPVSQHHHLVEERLDGPALLLQPGRSWPQHEHAAAPLVGRHNGRDAAL